MARASGGHVHPTDHGDAVPALLSPGVYVPMTENPQVSGRVLLQLADNTPNVAAEFTADTPDEYNATLVRALRALADEIEHGES